MSNLTAIARSLAAMQDAISQMQDALTDELMKTEDQPEPSQTEQLFQPQGPDLVEMRCHMQECDGMGYMVLSGPVRGVSHVYDSLLANAVNVRSVM